MESIIGLFVFFFIILPCIGIIALVVYLVRRRRAGLRKDQILERWDVLIENGRGAAESIYNSIVAALTSAEPPGVSWQRQEIRAGGVLTGKVYDGLVVTNPRLEGCKIYIFAYDYGADLHTAWFLTMQLGWMKSVLAMSFLKLTDPRAVIFYLDIPQELELSAYVSTVHDATKKAVGALMGKLEQDFSRVNTKSKGFLEVW